MHLGWMQERTIFSAVTNIITHLIKNIPMHAWLTALPQLISRMCHPNKDVAEQVPYLKSLLQAGISLRRRGPGGTSWQYKSDAGQCTG